MHTFGHPCDLDAPKAVADEFDIPLIEDAAESLGSYYKGTHTGNQSAVATLSFNGNKTITNRRRRRDHDERWRTCCETSSHFDTTAKQPHKWEFIHDAVGFNYRLPNINAALGCAQLESLPSYLQKKRLLAETYIKAFASVPGIQSFSEASNGAKAIIGSTLFFWTKQTTLLASIRGHEYRRVHDTRGVATDTCWTCSMMRQNQN